ncbi:hypothetical protein ACIBL3_46080 [Kribbella sp. NPDC050124]|uniref:hypothetical protein n=1 Tax=Kribbella sp. NPDC050124 TaxID=3364114 RepID=UPI00378ED459
MAKSNQAAPDMGCRAWTDGEQPKYALRLSAEGLWLAGLPTYSWNSVRGLRTRTTLRAD